MPPPNWDVGWMGDCEIKVMMVTDTMKSELLDSVAECVKKEMELQNLKKRL